MRAIAVLPLLLLVGCAGIVERKAVRDNSGRPFVNSYGFVQKEKVKVSRSVAIWQAASEAIKEVQEQAQSQCATVAEDKEMGATGWAEYWRYQQICAMQQGNYRLVAAALGLPQGQAEAISRQASASVKYVQDGMNNRTSSITKGLLGGVIGIVTGRAIESGHDALSKVGTEAARTGNTTVNGLTVSQSQSGTASSNDGGSAGEGIGGAGGGSVTGESSDSLNLAIGQSRIYTAQDSGTNLIGNGSQKLDASANGAVVNDASVDQIPVIDDNQGDQSNQPSNGNNNGLIPNG